MKSKSDSSIVTNLNTISPAEIARCVKQRMASRGLNTAMEEFEAMERLLSGLPCWPLVKQEVEQAFAEERQAEREVQREEELERIKAAAPQYHVTQMLPQAQAGLFAGSEGTIPIGQFIGVMEPGATANYVGKGGPQHD